MTEREALLDCITIVAGRGPVTLADLAARFRLPVNTAWALVQTLLERGALERGERVPVKRGRPRTGFVRTVVEPVRTHRAHTHRLAPNGIIRDMEASPYDAVHTANQTDRGLRYTMTDLMEFPTLDGGGYNAKLREYGQIIGWITDAGDGGEPTIHVDAPHLDAYLAHLALLAPVVHEAEALLLIDLNDAEDMESRSRTKTMLRFEGVDDLGFHPVAQFSKPGMTRERLLRHRDITTEHTHFWQTGFGWMPLR